jgi:hypothetical protein
VVAMILFIELFSGYTVMNKSKHQSVKFLDEREAAKAVNDPRFLSLEEFDNSYEVLEFTLQIVFNVSSPL